jgi:hypothetical protein
MSTERPQKLYMSVEDVIAELRVAALLMELDPWAWDEAGEGT